MRACVHSLPSPAAVAALALTDCDGPHTLGLVYCPPDWDAARPVLQALRARLPHAVLVALSTAGHFACSDADRCEIVDDTAVLQLITLARGSFTLVSSESADNVDAATQGAALMSQLPSRDLQAVLIFSDGSHTDGAALMDGLRRALPEGVAVAGGMAGDGERFAQTWLWDGARRMTAGAAVIGVCGDVLVACASGGGWDSFGVDREITAADGAELIALDGRPALELYREYLGERSAALPASALLFPLLVSGGSGEPVVRTILGIDNARGSIRLAGAVAVGQHARLMRANPNRLIGAAESSCLSSHAALRAMVGDGALAAIVVSCVGRRLVLKQRSEEEAESVAATLGARAAVAGFYSYGEFSGSGLSPCSLHNQTFTLALIGERAAVPSAS